MALYSMTGYGRAAAQGNGLRATVEIQSVNRKHLDIQISAPPTLNAWAAEIQNAVAAAVHRGRVGVSIDLQWTDAARAAAVRVDKAAARAYCEALREAAKFLGMDTALRAETLLRIPGLVTSEPPAIDAEEHRAVVFRAVEKALRALQQTRKKEGAELERDLRGRLAELASIAAAIGARAPDILTRRRRVLEQRLAEAGAGAGDGGDALARELVLFADRSDVSEELTRLAVHLRSFRDRIRGGSPAGRELDFLAQELHREINTTGSKANDAELAGGVVRFKTELEKVREQVQNIE
jgi:uncharacterized protein (TIGR00255 family)